MTDLTKITTPLGLLDEETRAALTAHGGPYERYCYGSYWEEVGQINENWDATIYRVKPQPPKPREWWLVLPIAKDTEAEATAFRAECHRISPDMGFLNIPIIRVREVLE